MNKNPPTSAKKPGVVDEAKLVSELAAAEAAGITIFSDRLKVGHLLRVDFGLCHLADPFYEAGVLQLVLLKSNGAVRLPYLAHNVSPLLGIEKSLRGLVQTKHGTELLPLPTAEEPMALAAEDDEFYMAGADLMAGGELVEVVLAGDRLAVVFQVEVREVHAWAWQIGEVYSGLTTEERQARIIICHAEGDGAYKAPLKRMAAEGDFLDG